ncbi:Endoglucanase 3 [Hordeum vulgare]|nr:Endoglucanase 3 [Hordeum vulgare]
MTGAPNARARILRADVMEMTRATRFMRFLVQGGPLPPVREDIQYFIDGCRDGTLLKHKLMCSEPTSLAVLMAKADKYATADSAMRVKVTASDKVVPTPATPKPAGTIEAARTTTSARRNS